MTSNAKGSDLREHRMFDLPETRAIDESWSGDNRI
jgi:hypothetical protein